jgi:hypothetical protein
MTRNSNKGFALGVVLIGLIALTSVFVFFMGRSQRFREVTEQRSSQAQAQWEVLGSIENLKAELLRQVQARLSSLEAGSAPETPLNVSLQTLVQAQRELAGQALELSCVGEGPAMSACSLSQIFPKVFRTMVKSFSDDGQMASLIRAEIQVQNAKLNSYAFLVKNETRAELNIGKSMINGLFGVNFSSETLEATPAPRIRFRTETGPITFQKAFVTNISSSSDLIVNDQNNLHMNGGMILGHRSLSFENLPLLYADLKANAVNHDWSNDTPWSSGWMNATSGTDPMSVGTVDEDEVSDSGTSTQGTAPPPPSVTTILCSRVRFTGPLTLDYEKYNTVDCSGSPVQAFQGKTVGYNQTLYAEGSKVLLSQTGDDFRQNAIAIVSDGNVHLETPLVRNPSSASTESYITLISRGNLIVDAQTKSLVEGNLRLSDLASAQIPTDGSPTFQADLSFIGIGEQNSSVVFDSSLFNVAGGISLGNAVFNGLFVSTSMPTSKVITTNGGSTSVRGFTETNWNFPLALQGLTTDWFRAELSGGVLQAVVTQIQKTEKNLQQALQDMNASGQVLEIETTKGAEIAQ